MMIFAGILSRLRADAEARQAAIEAARREAIDKFNQDNLPRDILSDPVFGNRPAPHDAAYAFRANSYNLIAGFLRPYTAGQQSIRNTMRWHRRLNNDASPSIADYFNVLRRNFVRPFNGMATDFPGVNSAYGLVGTAIGVGLPILAGAAAFSGIANLLRGRFRRGLVMLAGGAALTAGIYGATVGARTFLENAPDPTVPRDLNVPAFMRRNSARDVNRIMRSINGG